MNKVNGREGRRASIAGVRRYESIKVGRFLTTAWDEVLYAAGFINAYVTSLCAQ